eukprot:scaffold251558_cov15-Tisochrysis_lutea.AAC.1
MFELGCAGVGTKKELDGVLKGIIKMWRNSPQLKYNFWKQNNGTVFTFKQAQRGRHLEKELITPKHQVLNKGSKKNPNFRWHQKTISLIWLVCRNITAQGEVIPLMVAVAEKRKEENGSLSFFVVVFKTMKGNKGTQG